MDENIDYLTKKLKIFLIFNLVVNFFYCIHSDYLYIFNLIIDFIALINIYDIEKVMYPYFLYFNIKFILIFFNMIYSKNIITFVYYLIQYLTSIYISDLIAELEYLLVQKKKYEILPFQIKKFNCKYSTF